MKQSIKFHCFVFISNDFLLNGVLFLNPLYPEPLYSGPLIPIWDNYYDFRVAVIRFISNLNLKNEIKVVIRLGRESIRFVWKRNKHCSKFCKNTSYLTKIHYVLQKCVISQNLKNWVHTSTSAFWQNCVMFDKTMSFFKFLKIRFTHLLVRV